MIVPWKRFWVPMGQAIHCGADGKGFLNDPDDAFGQHFNPNVFSLRELLDRRCLVLLGEPGMGKSITIELEREHLKQLYGDRNCIWIRFRDIPDTATFTRRVFESMIWRDWQSGAGKLLLVIDGIDEGRLKIPNFISYLRAELETIDTTRINLILVCRVADWPEDAGNQLQALWDEGDTTRKFELCPLRQIDVRTAAECNETDADAFLRAIYEKHAVGLAARPVTLFMLLRAFSRDYQLPGTFRDLYQKGCRILCAEVDPGRVEEIQVRYPAYLLPSEEQKLSIASRIATLLMLSGRTAIYYGRAENAVADDLLLSEIVVGKEMAEGVEFSVNDAWVINTLSSALFSARGENRLGFAHQTFAEALAAKYLTKTPLVQVKALLCQRDIAQQYVIPQLAEIGAWLAGDNIAFLDFLLASEPEILLRTDVALIPDNQKQRLLIRLIEKASNQEIFDSPGSDRFYAGLKFPGMSDVLLATITDKGRNMVARRMAMEIGGDCRESDLVTVLLDIISDENDESALKKFAARALAKLTPDNRLAELVPLVDGTVSDPDDELKGEVLEALIPKFSSVGNAIPWLTRPQNDHFFGAYTLVLHQHIPSSIVAADIPALLDFVLDRWSCFEHANVFKEMADKSFCEAAKLLSDPLVVTRFVSAWLEKTRNHRPLPLDNNFKFNTILRETEEVRRCIIVAILSSSQTNLEDVRWLVGPRNLVLSDADLPWFLEQLPTVDPATRPKWIEAIRQQVHIQSVVKCWDAFLDAVSSSPELEAIFGESLIRAWQIDSPIAIQAKAEWVQVQQMAEANRRARPRPIEDIIEELVLAGLSGKTDSWVNLSAYLFRETGPTGQDFYSVDLSKAAGWLKATSQRQGEILRIARQFLIAYGDPRSDPNNVTNFTFAGFRALGLLAGEIRTDISLQGVVRDKWLPALFDITVDGNAYKKSVSLAFDLAPESCRERLIRDFAEDKEYHHFMHLLRALEQHWCADLSEIVIQLVVQRPTSDVVHNILKFLAKVDRIAALNCFNWLLLELEVSPDPGQLKNLLSAGISNLTNETRQVIEPILSAQPELAKLVYLQVADHNESHSSTLMLASTVDGMKQAYIALRELFPIDEDPPPDGIGDARWAVGRLRDQQLTSLTSLGTTEACRALQDLALKYPESSLWIRWRFKECLNLAREKAWRPCSPKQILQLVERSANRLIVDEEDLLEVVMESLERFEVSLVGTNNPLVAGLWNYQGGGNRRNQFAPKDEEDLSGAVAAWLQGDLGPSRGIILNREVQPRRGQRTDILVDAVSSEDHLSRLTIVIEVKGCWNPEIPIAIQDQLINDYLIPNGWAFGIFLVGWYMCPRWDSTAKRPIKYLAAESLEHARTEVATMVANFDGKQSPFVVRGYVLDCRLT